jgi:hypothetical protein
MEQILARLRSEFLEMPGLRLTAVQVQRLCGVEPALCETALDSLVAARFLSVRPDGTYARVQDSQHAPPRFMKAALTAGSRTARAS